MLTFSEDGSLTAESPKPILAKLNSLFPNGRLIDHGYATVPVVDEDRWPEIEPRYWVKFSVEKK